MDPIQNLNLVPIVVEQTSRRAFVRHLLAPA
jgi:hypothetical protein